MKLPNGINAAIPTEKVEQYLLSDVHAVGRAKSRFFRGVGYRHEDPSVLEADLAFIARNEQVSEVIQTRHGTKYVMDGRVNTHRVRVFEYGRSGLLNLVQVGLVW